MNTWCRICLFAGIAAASPVMAQSATADGASAVAENAAAVTSDPLDSGRIEQDLQQLSWKQFRAVVEAVPKLKADVDAYGALGWSYVEANYRRYGWKKKVARLDDAEKRKLLDLIVLARTTHE